MKKLILILFVALVSCSNYNEEKNQQVEIMEKMNNSQLTYFSSQDNDNSEYKKISEFKQMVSFMNLCDTLVSTRDHVKKDSLLKEIQGFIEEKIRDSLIRRFASSIENNEKLFTYNIEVLKYAVNNYMIKKYFNQEFKFDKVKPVTNVNNETVNLGDTCKANIYLCGFDTKNDYYAIIDGDTVNTRGLSINYSFKPTRRGLHKKKGRFFVYIAGSYVGLPFDFKVNVK